VKRVGVRVMQQYIVERGRMCGPMHFWVGDRPRWAKFSFFREPPSAWLLAKSPFLPRARLLAKTLLIKLIIKNS
jgi:hypothetical protein